MEQTGTNTSSIERRVMIALRGVVFVAGLWTVALGAAACGGPDWPQCENDDHCEENADEQVVNYVCVFGQCQECGRDSDCKDGKKCKKNRCVAPCKSDSQCGKGQACNAKTGDCVAASKIRGKAGDKCVETGDCQKGFTCYDKTCMTATDAEKKKAAKAAAASDGSSGSTCKASSDCKGGLVCYDAKCMSEEEAEMAAASAAANGGEICGDSRVFFAFNLHDLNPDAREILDGIARCLTNNADKKVRVEGHADERGTTQYNLNLGDKRALTAKEYLTRLGVDGARVGTLSYGEEKPLEPASNEDAWSKNRRVEVKFK